MKRRHDTQIARQERSKYERCNVFLQFALDFN